MPNCTIHGVVTKFPSRHGCARPLSAPAGVGRSNGNSVNRGAIFRRTTGIKLFDWEIRCAYWRDRSFVFPSTTNRIGRSSGMIVWWSASPKAELTMAAPQVPSRIEKPAWICLNHSWGGQNWWKSGLASGKQPHNYGTSPSLVGKSTLNWSFSIAM